MPNWTPCVKKKETHRRECMEVFAPSRFKLTVERCISWQTDKLSVNLWINSQRENALNTISWKALAAQRMSERGEERKKKYKRDEMKNNVVEYFWNYNKTIKIHNCDAVTNPFFGRDDFISNAAFSLSSFVLISSSYNFSSSHNHLISPALRIGSFKWINKGERCVFMTLFYAVFTHLLLSLIH